MSVGEQPRALQYHRSWREEEQAEESKEGNRKTVPSWQQACKGLPQEDGVITWVRLGWVVKGGRREDWPLKSATWGVIGDLDRFSSSGGSRPRAGDC